MFTPLIYTLRGIHKLNIKGVQRHEHTEIILKIQIGTLSLLQLFIVL